MTQPLLTMPYRNETLPLTVWSQRSGHPYRLLYNRHVCMGWTPEETLETPVGAPRRRSKRRAAKPIVHIAHAVERYLAAHPDEAVRYPQRRREQDHG